MTLRHIKIFVAICENEYNTTKTADVLHMTQPAVSLAIRELEEYYGIRLFDRIGRRLAITQTGLRMFSYASHILSLFDDMEKAMRDGDSFGLLRVGASMTIGSQFLPDYVKTFCDNYPQMQVHAMVAPSDQLEQQIINNALDFALIEGIAHHPSILSEEYMEDSLVVICPADSSFESNQKISIQQFQQQNFLLREHGSGTREVFDRAARQAGISVTPIWESASTTALVNAVIHGLGISVLPYRMVSKVIQQGDVIPIQIDGISFKRKLYIIYHKEKFLTASAKAFIDICKNCENNHPKTTKTELQNDKRKGELNL